MKKGRELFHRYTEKDSIYFPENFIDYVRKRFPESKRLSTTSAQMNGTKYKFYRLIFPEFESIIEIEEGIEDFGKEIHNTRIILRDESHSPKPNPLRNIVREARLEQKVKEAN